MGGDQSHYIKAIISKKNPRFSSPPTLILIIFVLITKEPKSSGNFTVL
jgi:hypothetical protein